MKQGKFLSICAIIWSVLCVIMIGGMVYYNYGYAKTPEKVSSYISDKYDISNSTILDVESYVLFAMRPVNEGNSILPIPAGLDADAISIRNDYLNRCVYLYIENDEKNFYTENVFFTTGKEIQGAYYYRDRGKDIFILPLFDLYDCTLIKKGTNIELEFSEIKKEDRPVVIVDVKTDSEETTMRAIEICQKKLESASQKIVFLNQNASGEQLEKLQQLIRDSGAVFLVELTTGQVDEVATTGMTAFYQDHYYVNGYGSVELADGLERDIVSYVSGTANGLFPATEDMQSILYAGVPAASVYLGSYANKEEALMLDSELFWEKVSLGLEDVVKEAFDK